MALENEHVTASSIEATEYPDLVREYQVTGVPKTVATGGTEMVEILGLQTEMPFIQQILEGMSHNDDGITTE